jgi:putative DNA primase/helicase
MNAVAIPPPPRGALPSDWRHLQACGLTADLLPVVSDPAVPRSDRSHVPEQNRGKVPSQMYGNAWGGISGWAQHVSSGEEIAAWSADLRHGICLQTRRVRALDVDVTDPATAAEIEGVINAVFGGYQLARRGRANSAKFLLAFEMPGPLTKRKLTLTPKSDTAPAQAIELLADGQQCIAHGTHPSGARYSWRDGPPVFHLRTIEEFEALWLCLKAVFPHATEYQGAEGLRTAVARQTATPKQIEDLRSALATPALVSAAHDYNVWSAVGLNLMCLGDDGLELFREFSDAAPNGEPDDADEFFHRNANTRTTSHFKAIFDKATEHGWRNPAKGARHDPVQAFGLTPSIPPPPPPPLIDRTDAGNANLLIQLAGGMLRYVVETKQWMHWSGSRWQIDDREVFINTRALDVAEHYMREASQMRATGNNFDAEDMVKWAKKCRNRTSLINMIEQARKVPGVPISVTELDRDPWLLGVENGVVDLRTGELRELESREEFVTKRCRVRYDPAAVAPRWQQFIGEITGAPIPAERDANGAPVPGTVGRFTPRPALARYLQKALGYSITGTTAEQKLFLAIGEGSNGKSVVFDTAKRLLGGYARSLPSEALMATARAADSERPTSLAAGLAGSRFVVASETKDGQCLDVGLVKNHTGDDEMTARRMRENPFTFSITHKLWVSTNNRPDLSQIDPAIRGRLHLIPFERRWNRPGEYDHDPGLPDGDKGLTVRFKAEAEGILAWLVAGAVAYRADGLPPPAEVVENTRAYIASQDCFTRWLTTAVEACPASEGTPAAALFAMFAGWCQDEGHKPKPDNATAFAAALKSRNVTKNRGNTGAKWGLRQK